MAPVGRFVLWGGLHGGYLLIHRGWRYCCQHGASPLPAPLAVLVTFVAVAVAWVPFRASDSAVAFEMYKGLFGFNGMALPADYATRNG